MTALHEPTGLVEDDRLRLLFNEGNLASAGEDPVHTAARSAHLAAQPGAATDWHEKPADGIPVVCPSDMCRVDGERISMQSWRPAPISERQAGQRVP